jgi:hypothetical protein
MKFDILLKIYEENRRRGINGNNATWKEEKRMDMVIAQNYGNEKAAPHCE